MEKKVKKKKKDQKIVTECVHQNKITQMSVSLLRGLKKRGNLASSLLEIFFDLKGNLNLSISDTDTQGIPGESKRTGLSGKKILKIDVDMIFEKIVPGIVGWVSVLIL